MKPYYEDDTVTIYHADCRDVLPTLGSIEAIISDPVWPNALDCYRCHGDPADLLAGALESISEAQRVVIQLGCDSDPRILSAVPTRWPFFRVCWLDYAIPGYKGRLLYTGDVAYAFGQPPASIPGRHLIPGKYTSWRVDPEHVRHSGLNRTGRKPTADYKDNMPHPSPRRLQHVAWLVWAFSDGSVVDPFMGSGTTLRAAKDLGRKAIGIEIEERYCEIAAKRMAQTVFDFGDHAPGGAARKKAGAAAAPLDAHGGDV